MRIFVHFSAFCDLFPEVTFKCISISPPSVDYPKALKVLANHHLPLVKCTLIYIINHMTYGQHNATSSITAESISYGILPTSRIPVDIESEFGLAVCTECKCCWSGYFLIHTPTTQATVEVRQTDRQCRDVGRRRRKSGSRKEMCRHPLHFSPKHTGNQPPHHTLTHPPELSYNCICCGWLSL